MAGSCWWDCSAVLQLTFYLLLATGLVCSCFSLCFPVPLAWLSLQGLSCPAVLPFMDSGLSGPLHSCSVLELSPSLPPTWAGFGALSTSQELELGPQQVLVFMDMGQGVRVRQTIPHGFVLGTLQAPPQVPQGYPS